MKEFYTVGEISKLFNVSTDTLRYYDKLNLIKPWKKGGNGYRYYSKAQFEMISTILLLRTAGTPLDRLHTVLNQDNSENIENELVSHKREIREKINHLEYLESRISSLHRNIQDVKKEGEMEIKSLPRFWVLSKDFENENDNLDIDEIVQVNQETNKEWVSFANIMSTIEKSDLMKGEYHKYKSYGFISEYPCETKSSGLSIIESRLYACANARILRIDLEDIDQVYDRLINFISEKGYSIAGEAIERNILDLYHGENREFIHYFKIYIPIEPGRI